MAVGADRGRSDVSAVWLRASAQLRGRARATVLLAVLVGLAGGMVLAAVAGARRTDAALPRFLARDHAADAVIFLPDLSHTYPATFAGVPKRFLFGFRTRPQVVGLTAAFGPVRNRG